MPWIPAALVATNSLLSELTLILVLMVQLGAGMLSLSHVTWALAPCGHQPHQATCTAGGVASRNERLIERPSLARAESNHAEDLMGMHRCATTTLLPTIQSVGSCCLGHRSNADLDRVAFDSQSVGGSVCVPMEHQQRPALANHPRKPKPMALQPAHSQETQCHTVAAAA